MVFGRLSWVSVGSPPLLVVPPLPRLSSMPTMCRRSASLSSMPASMLVAVTIMQLISLGLRRLSLRFFSSSPAAAPSVLGSASGGAVGASPFDLHSACLWPSLPHLKHVPLNFLSLGPLSFLGLPFFGGGVP